MLCSNRFVCATAALTALFGQHAPCKAEFQSLHRRRQRALRWFADQKMNVFGHYHVAEDHPLVALPYLFQHFHEQVAATRTGEQRLPVVATEGKEMQVVSTLPAFQAPGHITSVEERLAFSL